MLEREKVALNMPSPIKILGQTNEVGGAVTQSGQYVAKCNVVGRADHTVVEQIEDSCVEQLRLQSENVRPRSKIVTFVLTNENAINLTCHIDVSGFGRSVSVHYQYRRNVLALEAFKIMTHVRLQSATRRMRDKERHFITE